MVKTWVIGKELADIPWFPAVLQHPSITGVMTIGSRLVRIKRYFLLIFAIFPPGSGLAPLLRIFSLKSHPRRMIRPRRFRFSPHRAGKDLST
jgi:hypothetical protein